MVVEEEIIEDMPEPLSKEIKSLSKENDSDMQKNIDKPKVENKLSNWSFKSIGGLSSKKVLNSGLVKIKKIDNTINKASTSEQSTNDDITSSQHKVVDSSIQIQPKVTTTNHGGGLSLVGDYSSSDDNDSS